jgi:hypothetical protein
MNKNISNFKLRLISRNTGKQESVLMILHRVVSGRVGPEPLDGRRSATVINALVSTFSIFFLRLWRCGKINFRVCSQETLFMLDCQIFACIKRTLSPSQPGTSKIRQAWERKTVQEQTLSTYMDPTSVTKKYGFKLTSGPILVKLPSSLLTDWF